MPFEQITSAGPVGGEPLTIRAIRGFVGRRADRPTSGRHGNGSAADVGKGFLRLAVIMAGIGDRRGSYRGRLDRAVPEQRADDRKRGGGKDAAHHGP
jgi:hypothetical protein